MSISISSSKAMHSLGDLLGFENSKIAHRVLGGNANYTKKAKYLKKVNYYVHVKKS